MSRLWITLSFLSLGILAPEVKACVFNHEDNVVVSCSRPQDEANPWNAYLFKYTIKRASNLGEACKLKIAVSISLNGKIIEYRSWKKCSPSYWLIMTLKNILIWKAQNI